MEFTEESSFVSDAPRAPRTSSNISGVNPLSARRGSTKTSFNSNVVATVDTETPTTKDIDEQFSPAMSYGGLYPNRFSTVDTETPSSKPSPQLQPPTSPPPPVPQSKPFKQNAVVTEAVNSETKEEFDERPSAGMSFSGLYPNRTSTLETDVSTSSKHPSAKLPPPSTPPPPVPQAKPSPSYQQSRSPATSTPQSSRAPAESLATIRLDDESNEPYEARTVSKPVVAETGMSSAVRRVSTNILSFTSNIAALTTGATYTAEEDKMRQSADLSFSGMYPSQSIFEKDGPALKPKEAVKEEPEPVFAKLPALATKIADDVELQCLASKQCPGFALLWQERFFVLKKDGAIHYYENREAYINRYAPKGVIALRDVQQSEFSRTGGFNDAVAIFNNRLNIHVNSKNNRIYKLKFNTAEEAETWKTAISKHLDVFFKR